jgi:3-oxoacyl-[acyl-carrier-protein] synthase II
MSRTVFITGVGPVTGFGVGAEALWEGLCAGRTAIGPITRFDPIGFDCRMAAEMPADFSAKNYVPKTYRKAVKVMARDIELAVAAAQAAALDAGLTTRETASSDAEMTIAPSRFGCQIGAGLIACDTPEMAMAMASALDESGAFSLKVWGESGMNNLTPLWLLKYLPNMLACHVTIIHGAQGPSNTITCNEASGLLSLGESRSVIRRGAADACFSGSAESKINQMGMLRSHLLRRLAPTNGGTNVLAPYAESAPGTILGEVGGLVIIEEAEHATARDQAGYAVVEGFGAGHSPRSEDPVVTSEGLATAIESAIADAGCAASDIDAIVPHASGHAHTDAEERAALSRIFGDRIADIPLITLPPAIGDGMAGGGGAAICAAALSLRHQKLPARLHASTPVGLAAGAADAQDAALNRILVCTNAMGGQNAAVVLRRT